MADIVLLDPSLPEAQGLEADNFGDIIIHDAVSGVLDEIFPGVEIVRVPTKRRMTRSEVDAINRARLVFLGGTNIFSGDLRKYNQWKIASPLFHRPTVSGVIALGIGWWQYQNRTTWRTRRFYRHVLHPGFTHSLRDAYTCAKVAAMDIPNVVNTACPTMWSLDGRISARSGQETIAFTLTDYKPLPDADNPLLSVLLEHSSSPLLFFPQGRHDVEYISSLKVYRENRARIAIMSRSISELDAVAADEGVSFVGTRLHGGVRFLQKGRGALILAVDNRATEIGRDTGLPVLPRRDTQAVTAWLQGKRDFGPIHLPTAAIAQWKAQFAGA